MGKSIFLGIPHSSGICSGTFNACFQTGIPGGEYDGLQLSTRSTSLLTYTFNELWVEALNRRESGEGPDIFCMLHSDVIPIDPGWLLTLVEERDKQGCDILSVVLPIKDERGYSSTAIYVPSEDHLQRITMTEAHSLPKTFDATDYGISDGSILPNTGLWVCDFTKPWVEEACFTMRDRIFKFNGKWTAQCLSEDWNFGYWCRRKELVLRPLLLYTPSIREPLIIRIP